ncbi:hypothetical protein [Sulfitobacter pontiacus]|uniref:hypothetical protein n=1 Tax=Sulfitobacter pontiacus TaxID=60137 RepID=UPI0036D80068
MSRYSPDIASDAEIERLLHHMPAVARLAAHEWAKGFAKSLIVQSYRKGWKPSLKQLHIMRELVADLFRQSGDGDDNFEVIDGA